MNIVDIKMKLVDGSVSHKVGLTCANNHGGAKPRHILERSTSWHWCTYCSLFLEFGQTRYRC